MNGNSRLIVSAQDGPHRDLEALVRRHLEHRHTLKHILQELNDESEGHFPAW